MSTPEEIDSLIEKSDWFPFVETWSAKTPAEMFQNLVQSKYGGTIADMPKIRIYFTPADFKFSLPDRFRKPIPTLTSERGGFVILTHDLDNKDYREMNAIGEFYMEDLRLSSSKRRFMTNTPIEMWDRDKKRIVEIARTKYGPEAGPYEIRNTVYSFTKESNPFRPSNALAIYAIFNARRILDMSAGWGDRLIGALAWAGRSKSVIRYQGYDPFAALQPRYQAMFQDFNPDNGSRIGVTCSPFEDAPLEEEEFDLAFTSPPYFDFEEYGLASSATADRSGQSTVRYSTEKEWVSGFLKPMMKKAALCLRIGGYLAINIEGPFMYNVLDRSMIDEELFGPQSPRPGVLSRPLRMEYLGIVGYRSDDPHDKITHPTFVWRRTM